MNNYYNKNIEAIKLNDKAFPMSIFTNLEKSSLISGFEVVETKDKKLSAKVACLGKTLSLHSAYNPTSESQKLAEDIFKDTEVNMIFLIGLGAGYLHNAIRKISRDINVAIIEPDYNMFYTMLNSFPLEHIIKDRNTIFFVGDNQLNDIEAFITMSATKKVKIVSNRVYSTMFYDIALMYNQSIFEIIDKKAININTMGKFEKLWAYNISGNTDSILFHYGVNKFFDMFKDKPAIVVSAGPSLQKNIEQIKSLESKCVIIAVDTVLKSLQYHNIKPHFITTIDPQKKNAKYFRGIDTSDSILIAESSIDREVLANHKGGLYFNDSIFPLAQLFMKYLGARGELTVGGSVSTGAFDLAIRLGCSPIIMVGLDLSFPDHQTHIRGSYHEEDFFTQISRLDTYDSRIYKILIQGNLKKEQNIYGDTVYIDSRFQMYRDWYEKHIEANKDVKVYNATEGGISIKGMENTTLEQVAKTIAGSIDFSSLDRSDKASSVDDNKKAEIALSLEKELKKIEADMDSIMPTVDKCVELSEKLVADVKRHRKVDKILKELSELDAKLFYFTSLSSFISLTMQKTIKLITEGYDLADESEDLSKDEKNALNSFLLYTEIKKSIEFNVYIFKRCYHRLR